MSKDDTQHELVPRLRFPAFRATSAWYGFLLDELEAEGRVELGRGKVISHGDMRTNPGPHPVYSSSVIDGGLMGTYGDYLFNEELITWSVDGGGHFFYRPKHKFSVTNVSGFMRVLSEDIVCRFLAYQLQRIHASLTFDDQQKAHPSVIRKLYTVGLPEPDEQHCIADCLGALDDLVAAEGRKLEALRDYRKGLLQRLFPREGQTRPCLRFAEFQNAGDWELKSLGDLLRETQRAVEMDDNEQYSLVTVKRRYGGVVFRQTLKGSAIKVKSQFRVEAEDFLISKRQAVHDACGVVPEALGGSIVSNEYSVLTARPSCAIRFMEYFVQQPNVSRSFLDCSVGIVIEKMLFKLAWWLNLDFLTPSLAEQWRIADCLMSLDARIAAQADKLDALRAHKRGLMQQLFPATSPEGAAT